MPFRQPLSAIFFLLLAACTQSQKDTTSQALDQAGTEASASTAKVRNYLDVGHKPPPPATQKVQPRYCYHTYQDVICYSKPLPGEEYRLTGFQTQSGKTGYVIDPPEADNPDLPPLKAMTVPPPPPVQGSDNEDKNLKEITVDPSELEPRELVPQKQE